MNRKERRKVEKAGRWLRKQRAKGSIWMPEGYIDEMEPRPKLNSKARARLARQRHLY